MCWRAREPAHVPGLLFGLQIGMYQAIKHKTLLCVRRECVFARPAYESKIVRVRIHYADCASATCIMINACLLWITVCILTSVRVCVSARLLPVILIIEKLANQLIPARP